MSTIAAGRREEFQRISWPRVGAWSGSLALHGVAAIAMALPVAVGLSIERKPEPTPILVAIAEPPPKAIETPPDPTPPPPRSHKPVVRENVVVATTNIPVVTKPSDVVERETPASNDGPTDIGPSSDSTAVHLPIEVGTLAYESVYDTPYPRASMREREQGVVVLRVLVDALGMPTRIELARSSGHTRLDQAARESVKRWRFRPPVRDGAPVPAWGLVPVEFRLDRA